MSNLTYLWSQGMVDKIAEKVANEKPSKADEIIERVKNQNIKSQHIDHVEAERLADLARERQRELAQMEMFDDPDWNYSGRR